MFKKILFRKELFAAMVSILLLVGVSNLDVWGHGGDGNVYSPHVHKEITSDGGKTWHEIIDYNFPDAPPPYLDGTYRDPNEDNVNPAHTIEIDNTPSCWTLPWPPDENREYHFSDTDIDPYTGKTCGEVRKGRTGSDDQTPQNPIPTTIVASDDQTSQNPIPTTTVASDDQTSQNPIPTTTVAVVTPDSGPVVTPGIIPPASQPQPDPVPQVQPPIESEEPKIEVIVAPSRELIISEMMLRNYIRTGKNGNYTAPAAQWIEIHNLSKTLPADTIGWQLQIRSGGDRVKHRTINIRLAESRRIEPGESILIVQQSGRHSEGFGPLNVFNLANSLSYSKRIDIRRNEKILSETHLNIRLISPDKEIVDEVGNIEWSWYTPETPVALWELPQGEDLTQRSSLIRRYKYKGGEEPIKGTAEGAWVLANSVISRFDSGTIQPETYYGHHKDVGTAGYVIEGRLPVELSAFSPKLVDDTIVISWATASEVNNAGFNILRSVSEKGKFVKINPALIQGQGTTSHRTDYQWEDTTAKPNTTYYYRIQDVSFDGDIQTLRQSHLKGFVSPQSKILTTWGNLKQQ